MNQFSKLSLEQEFYLKKFADRVESLSAEQAKACLIELRRQMMIKDNIDSKMTSFQQDKIA
ncbi:MAG: NblA/ycf18 family protein [Prochloraceae cyanobacterium]|nr:NblA/ycf18 family protein [Prochloraceae cyanobacterium]